MPYSSNIKPYRWQSAVLLLGLGLTMGAMFMLRKCSFSSEHYALSSSGQDTIDVAIEYSPMSFYRYDDTLGGFNYDLLRLIAQRHNLIIKFHPMVNLDQSLKLIADNTYDMLVADIPATAEMKGRFTMLEPIQTDCQVLVQRRDSISGHGKIQTQLDLAGDTVWVVDGSTVVSRIVNLSHEIGDTIHIVTEPEYGQEQLVMMTALGEIKNAVVSEHVARSMAKDYPNLDFSTNISFTQFQSWVVGKKKPSLCDSLNRWIQEAKLTDEFKRLRKRYTSK